MGSLAGRYIDPAKFAVRKLVGLDDAEALVSVELLAEVQKDRDDAASHEAGHHACESTGEQHAQDDGYADVDTDVVVKDTTEVELEK